MKDTRRAENRRGEKESSSDWTPESAVDADEYPVMLCFSLKGIWFAMDARTAAEIVGLQKVTAVPGAAPYIQGVISLHGRAVAVLDLGRFLGLAMSPTEVDAGNQEKAPRILVLHIDGMTVGVIADEVDRIFELEPEQLRASQVHHEGRLGEFVSAEFDIDDRIVTVIDPRKIIKIARVM